MLLLNMYSLLLLLSCAYDVEFLFVFINFSHYHCLNIWYTRMPIFFLECFSIFFWDLFKQFLIFGRSFNNEKSARPEIQLASAVLLLFSVSEKPLSGRLRGTRRGKVMGTLMKLQTLLWGAAGWWVPRQNSTQLWWWLESLINTVSHIDRSIIIATILFVSLPWFCRQAMEQVGVTHEMKFKG